MTRCSQGPRRPSLGILLTHFVGRAEARKSVPLGRNKHCRRRDHHRNAFGIEARRLTTLRFLSLCVPNVSIIFLWITVPIILTFDLRVNVGVTEAALFGISEALAWQNR
jgi:hypothetical protein